MSKINLVGERFGRLIVLKDYGRTSNQSVLWECKCDCGGTAIVITNNLTRRNTQSCGCIQKESMSERRTHNESRKGSVTPEYRTWNSIKQRCYNPNCKEYDRYGGRGIKVCQRWLDGFDNFLSDMGRRPSNNHSLDRFPNNDGDYEPLNCRWGTPAQQTRGKSNNRWVEWGGLRMVLQDWANLFGIRRSGMSDTLKRKSIPEAFSFYQNKYKPNGLI